MKKQIELQGRTIDYSIRAHPRARNVRLTVTGDVRCIVTTPKRFPYYRIEQFLRDHAHWVVSTIERIEKTQPRQTAQERRIEYIRLKEKARTLVHERIKYFNTFYQVDFKAISIRDQRTRWGSCSRNKHLSFNYKLVLLPPRLADYVVVHELCHLKEFSHSPAFWRLVAETVPEYKVHRRELRERTKSLM